MNKKYDIKLITKWEPPEGDDLRPLIAMPNLPKPLHNVNPRLLLGKRTWDFMRKACYHAANDTCEICGERPEVLRRRHGHETFKIDYEEGTAEFVRVFCLDSTCHLGGIHTGRALTLYRQGSPLYPKEFLLEGAEKAFRIISEYNADYPDVDLRAYTTFLDYLKCEELREPMERLIEKYQIKFYEEDKKKLAEWGDWRLIIGNKEYPTPYKDEKEWEKAMEEANRKDTARIATREMKNNFSNEVYSEIAEIIKTEEQDGRDKGTAQ